MDRLPGREHFNSRWIGRPITWASPYGVGDFRSRTFAPSFGAYTAQYSIIRRSAFGVCTPPYEYCYDRPDYNWDVRMIVEHNPTNLDI